MIMKRSEIKEYVRKYLNELDTHDKKGKDFKVKRDTFDVSAKKEVEAKKEDDLKMATVQMSLAKKQGKKDLTKEKDTIDMIKSDKNAAKKDVDASKSKLNATKSGVN